MAEEVKSVVALAAGDPIYSSLAPKEIVDLIADSPRGDISYFNLTDVSGREHWINTSQVVSVSASGL